MAQLTHANRVQPPSEKEESILRLLALWTDRTSEALKQVQQLGGLLHCRGLLKASRILISSSVASLPFTAKI